MVNSTTLRKKGEGGGEEEEKDEKQQQGARGDVIQGSLPRKRIVCPLT